MTWQWRLLADLTGEPGDVSLYGPAWAPTRNVPADADLNTFKVPGIHRITTPDTGTILNLPPGTRVASELENVTTGTGADSIFAQRVTEVGEGARKLWRTAFTSGGTFTPWALEGTSGAPITEWHVFLAVGQSNMSGRGIVSAANGGKYMQSRIAQFGAKQAAPRVITTATVPLDMHDTSAAAALSPASVFANNYLRTQPDNVGVLLIPAAHGGTGFTTSTTTETWTPGAATNPIYDLPKLAVDQTKEAIVAAKATGSAVTLKGILWHQGEDNSSMARATYETNLDTLIAYFRAQLGDPKLPFIVGQMSIEGIAANAGRQNIDAAHQDTPNRVPYTGFAAGTTGGHNPGDTTHLSKFGLDFLGRTYLEAYEQLKVATPALAAVPGAVIDYITNDPTVVQAAADLAANNADLVAKWRPNTAYTAGQQVVSPDGDNITRTTSGTTGATFSMTNWAPSATAAATAGKISASEKGAANGVATLDAGSKIPTSQLPGLLTTPLANNAKLDTAAPSTYPLGTSIMSTTSNGFGVNFGTVVTHRTGIAARTTQKVVQSSAGLEMTRTEIAGDAWGAWSTTNVDTSATAANASTLVKRDASGRAKVAAPAATDDVATKGTVDTAFAAGAWERGVAPTAPAIQGFTYGDSWNYGAPTTYANLLKDSMWLSSMTRRAISGSRIQNVAVWAQSAVGEPWTPGTKGLVLLGALLNNQVEADDQANRDTALESMRAVVARFSSGTIRDSTDAATFTYNGTWQTYTDDMTSGGTARYANPTLAADAIHTATVTVNVPAGVNYLQFIGLDLLQGTGATFILYDAGAVEVARTRTDGRSKMTLGNGIGEGRRAPVVMRVPGTAGGTFTLKVTTPPGYAGQVYGWVDCLITLADKPPMVVILKPVHVLHANYQKTALETYLRTVPDTVAAEFANVVVADPNVGFDPNTMLDTDLLHPLAAGQINVATQVKNAINSTILRRAALLAIPGLV